MFEKLKTLLNHERYQVIAAVLCIPLIFWGICCQSQTQSLIDPDQQVNRDQLDAQVANFLNDAEVRYRDLDRQDAFKQNVFDKVALFSQGGDLNPSGLLTLVFTFLGVGAITDNVRKRRELRSLSNAPNPPP